MKGTWYLYQADETMGAFRDIDSIMIRHSSGRVKSVSCSRGSKQMFWAFGVSVTNTILG